MAITIKDIAKATGVSTMTVSRFLNEPEKLKPSTYEKVKKAVDEMGYEPNQVARLLQTNKTNIISAIIETKTSVLFEDVFTMQFETLMRTAVTKTKIQAVTAAR